MPRWVLFDEFPGHDQIPLQDIPHALEDRGAVRGSVHRAHRTTSAIGISLVGVEVPPRESPTPRPRPHAARRAYVPDDNACAGHQRAVQPLRASGSRDPDFRRSPTVPSVRCAESNSGVRELVAQTTTCAQARSAAGQSVR
ncbi:hypothetical protein ACRAWF_30515 [Streptomyces sp. L7]